MARGRVVPQRGWILKGGNETLTYDAASRTWIEDVILPFTDLSNDAAAIQREKSDFYMKRILLWFSIHYTPVGVGPTTGLPVHVKLGTVADDVTLQSGAAQQALDFDFNEWTRILQEDSVMCHNEQALVKDGGALSVSTAAVADERSFAFHNPVHRWDLNVNLGLLEDHSLVLGFGPWNGGAFVVAQNDEFELDWKCKILVQKRRD